MPKLLELATQFVAAINSCFVSFVTTSLFLKNGHRLSFLRSKFQLTSLLN